MPFAHSATPAEHLRPTGRSLSIAASSAHSCKTIGNAMGSGQLSDPDETIKAKLQELAIGMPIRPPWNDAVSRLAPTSTDEERLAVYQAVRNSGSIPADAGFFLVANQIDDLVSHLPQPKLVEFEDQMQAIARAHRLEEDDLWEDGEEPEEYLKVHRRYIAAWDQLYLEELLARGENEIAQAFRDERREYDRRLETGRKFFFGAVTDNQETLFRWAQALVDEVSTCMEVGSPMGPLGYRYRIDEDLVELMVYATPVELVGGPDDGGLVDPEFHLDVGELSKVFDEVVHIGWNALGLNEEEGSFISVEGKFRGQDVFLQVLARAPEDEEPGLKLNLMKKRRR
jgi:hypothetical protein